MNWVELTRFGAKAKVYINLDKMVSMWRSPQSRTEVSTDDGDTAFFEETPEEILQSKRVQLDDLDRKLLVLVRLAVYYDDEGQPVKDAIDESDMVDAMRLLLQYVDAG